MDSSGKITADEMQQMLREVEKDSTITVLPCLQVDELNKDLHAGSCLCRVTVKYVRGGDQTQHTMVLIIKLLPEMASLADVFRQSPAFPREIQMFQVILPRMTKLLSQALPVRHKEFSARLYHTQKSPKYMIAVEDLAPKGFKTALSTNLLDLDHSLLAFRTLARFHAASVMIHIEDKSQLEIFDEYFFRHKAGNKTLMALTYNLHPSVIRTVETLPEFGRIWVERLEKRYQTLNEDLMNLWLRDDNAFNVLNHGDFGRHNLMYRYSEAGDVEDIMLVDFQCCSYNSPVLDLHQFLFSSVTEEVRDNHIDTLLREYHAELTATLELLGGPKNKTITLTQLIQEFDSKMLFGYHYTICALPLLGFKFDSDFKVEDLFREGDDFTNKIECSASGAYARILKRWLPVFVEKNIL